MQQTTSHEETADAIIRTIAERDLCPIHGSMFIFQSFACEVGKAHGIEPALMMLVLTSAFTERLCKNDWSNQLEASRLSMIEALHIFEEDFNVVIRCPKDGEPTH